MTIVLERSADGSLTLPAELLVDAASTRYSVERDGDRLLVAPEMDSATVLTHDEWMERWLELARHIGDKWPEGLSAVDAVNAIRR
jgi:hypothetical protein